MAEYDGVGRIFRTGSDVRPDKQRIVSRSDREKQRREEEGATKEAPHDIVELHAEDDAPKNEPVEPEPEQNEPEEEEEGFDISA